ncbi:hypothetical protein I3843_13G137600 [Carya illinoinensis]|nr:hypothetical protein I3843_13G137600 [Carya illinoinensis]
MDSFQATYKEEDDEVDKFVNPTTNEPPPSDNTTAEPLNDTKPEPMSSDSDNPPSSDTNKSPTSIPNGTTNTNNNNNDTTTTNTTNNNNDEEDDEEDPPPKKQKPLSSLTTQTLIPGKVAPMEAVPNPATMTTLPTTGTAMKKSKKKNNNVWVTKLTHKGKKKNKSNSHHNAPTEETVLITPIQKFPDKSYDTQDMKICLSKIYKAEKVELSAGSTKGYRMVRATRGVMKGAWYFEIKDGNNFGYRDSDGRKVHKALREKYGEEGYKEGDVIGFYISFPEGGLCVPKPPHLVLYKGQRYACASDAKEEAPKVVPGSEISFFKNGIWQGVAFKDLCGGHYYPAASMYTLPNQPNCVVKFNFGPDFEFFPTDFNERLVPRPMVEVPYHGFENQVENGMSIEKNH